MSAETLPAPAAPSPGSAAPAPAAPSPAAPGPSVTRLRAIAGLRRVLAFALAVGLLVIGIAAGYGVYVTTQLETPAQGTPGLSDATATPPSVQELVIALEADDPDATRAAVPGQPYASLTAEIQTWGLQEVDSVITLATFMEGPMAATHIVIQGSASDGSQLTTNLTVLTQDGAIVAFR
jgi:hypothetical protein